MSGCVTRICMNHLHSVVVFVLSTSHCLFRSLLTLGFHVIILRNNWKIKIPETDNELIAGKLKENK